MARFLRLLKSLIKLKWRFTPPPQRDVLLYFKTGADVIAPYFSPHEFQVLDLRESEVNIAVAIRCILSRDLSAQNYARQFIRMAKPKLVLTFIDNFPSFYLLKKEFPKVQIWLIQNGVRSDRGDLFGLLKAHYPMQSSQVDKMFVFGFAVGEKYLESISGEVVVHGSFKNNLVPLTQPKKASVAYISTYRPNQQRSFIVPESRPESPVTYEQIIERREQAIVWLAKYCAETQLGLTIIGKHESPEHEEAYYRSLLKNYDFEFVARKVSTSSYLALDKSEIIVFTSSTLGYESLARGKKTAAIMLDAEIIGAEALKFGWPAKLPDDGPFWTHRFSEQRLHEIMDYLRNIEDREWDQTRTQAIKDVITFDPSNSQFSTAINSLRQSWQ
ncbi:MAG: hypothetical protein O3A62_05425 [Actinomycetota bacterium]|nr:hypothetical protein [Actinomycetota bacterium]